MDCHGASWSAMGEQYNRCAATLCAMSEKRVEGNVFLASSGGVAVDAVGLAVWKYLGSNKQILGPKIFKQEQIAR